MSHVSSPKKYVQKIQQSAVKMHIIHVLGVILLENKFLSHFRILLFSLKNINNEINSGIATNKYFTFKIPCDIARPCCSKYIGR